IPVLAGQADAFAFNLIDSPIFQYGISSNKLFDFMAAARPVLFCCSSSNNPIADAGAGVTVPPENPAALAEAILELASLPLDMRKDMGMAGRRHLEEHYDMAVLADRLSKTLDDCLRTS